jgi:hypothetical protein
MTEAEWSELSSRVELCGRQKQEFLIKSVLHQPIVVVGNKLLAKKMEDTLGSILTELQRIETASELDEELLDPLRTAIEIIQGAST